VSIQARPTRSLVRTAPKDGAANEACWREALDGPPACGLSLRAFSARENLSANNARALKVQEARAARSDLGTIGPVHAIEDRVSSEGDIILTPEGVHVSNRRGFEDDNLGRVRLVCVPRADTLRIRGIFVGLGATDMRAG